MSSTAAIRLLGVRQNNLKGFDLELPAGKLIVVTGLSGAGKSSLVFDTLHAEGQRRYVETFSAYARQFMDRLERPKVDRIDNIRPSIAIAQGNTVKTSRSTVGTMTELTDYFKVWFCHEATLIDPATGQPITDDNPATIWTQARQRWPGQTAIVAFTVRRPENFTWPEVTTNLRTQGFTRLIVEGQPLRLDDTKPEEWNLDEIQVAQDRLKLTPENEARLLEAARTALHFGQGQITLLDAKGKLLDRFSEGLHSPATGKRFRAASPSLFSFNSPLGACPKCRGFGRVIEVDDRLVIPDTTKTLRQGAIRAFQGEVYSESQRDLVRACQAHDIPLDTPFRDLTDKQRHFVMEGEPDYGTDNREWPHAWYGVRRFFGWLESNTYKMHVRVFLSRYRAYVRCPACQGARLQPEALAWQWHGRTLPQLYQLPVNELLPLFREHHQPSGHRQHDLAAEAILTRLRYLDEVGLGYLTLDRTSRTLSGGEVERVNLTSCLGTALVDTLFVLDEPSVGLHARDIDRLIGILRRLADQGNTVVVVEHDESVLAAADHLIEVGPHPGADGGEVLFAGPPQELARAPETLSSKILRANGNGHVAVIPYHEANPRKPRPVSRQARKGPWLTIEGATKHNLQQLDLSLPLQRLVVLSGVSGSGKSTLLDHVIYQGWQNQARKVAEDPAEMHSWESSLGFAEVALVDQSPVSRTPRSNAALFTQAWDPIRELFAATDAARSRGLTARSFSFNSGDSRCPACEGLGVERVEMQFMADLLLPCQVCDGKRFLPEVLEVHLRGKNVDDVLRMTISEALAFFPDQPRVRLRLAAIESVGLGYLPFGQPFSTLSGGEAQRLKLVKYLARIGDQAGHSLILLDEPTTGLHREDVRRLIDVLQRLVDDGHSVIVIEHNLALLAAADWIIELGPEAGAQGGQIVFTGTPKQLARARTATSPFLRQVYDPTEQDKISRNNKPSDAAKTVPFPITTPKSTSAPSENLRVAEDPTPYGQQKSDGLELTNGQVNPNLKGHPRNLLRVEGAREHNLRNLSVDIPHREITVVTGVSGSGKSSLAFDIIFAEGQRRFMESMSAWARQYVEQLPRAEVDHLSGIPPTVAIEQRITRGTRKSTVATITEVAQYLRLLYARVGIPHSPVSGEPLVTQKPAALASRLRHLMGTLHESGQDTLLLCAPLIRGRKGHHEPLARWAAEHGYTRLRADGKLVPTDPFTRLDRFREHDVEVVVAQISQPKNRLEVTLRGEAAKLDPALAEALKLGKGAALVTRKSGKALAWLSTKRTDPATGEAFPELDPKHFSWNSAKGWCPQCRGLGIVGGAEDQDDTPAEAVGTICPSCHGTRLNPLARAVRLPLKDGTSLTLPDFLALTPSAAVVALKQARLDRRDAAILAEILPEIEERLKFMDTVGLDYLTLDRATATLSGGEAQRIRLAAQLGSNLSGVLYVLDEPSIGLHARDNHRLLDSLDQLRAKGNTLLVVEHDEDTMRRADNIIDLGPGAGLHGGQILAHGPLDTLTQEPRSLTGRYLREAIQHPRRGQYRPLPTPHKPRARKPQPWLALEGASLRNLRGFDLHLPLGRLIMVAGVSGAGKSTLIRDLLQPAATLAARENLTTLNGRDAHQAPLWPGLSAPPFKRLRGAETFRKVIEVDQSPIGKTPRSCPATYIGAFDLIREFFATVPEARLHGFTASTFSFNTKGGRCETCKGAGRVKLEMAFMPDAYLPCEDCDGGRYGPELANIRWKDKSIADVLAMSFEEAATFFDFHNRLRDLLGLMNACGLGYLTLGQSSPTLSGGEAQRLRLVSELAAGLPTAKDRAHGTRGHNLYLLEEPTIGLHLADCEKLIDLLHRLVDQGHTVVVIEHHLDLLAEADYLIEIGPEGGERGGQLLFQGPLQKLPQANGSPTREHLLPKLKIN